MNSIETSCLDFMRRPLNAALAKVVEGAGSHLPAVLQKTNTVFLMALTFECKGIVDGDADEHGVKPEFSRHDYTRFYEDGFAPLCNWAIEPNQTQNYDGQLYAALLNLQKGLLFMRQYYSDAERALSQNRVNIDALIGNHYDRLHTAARVGDLAVFAAYYPDQFGDADKAPGSLPANVVDLQARRTCYALLSAFSASAHGDETRRDSNVPAAIRTLQKESRDLCALYTLNTLLSDGLSEIFMDLNRIIADASPSKAALYAFPSTRPAPDAPPRRHHGPA